MSRILISDLTALSSETKRKHPHVRLACETALAALKQDADDALTTAANDFGPPLENLLLKPILLACETKVPKAIALGVALLQRVIGMNAVPEPSLPVLIDLLPSLSQRATDVDVQLKLLQTVAALLSTYRQIHNDALADLLRLCFTYQQSSKVAVVSSTAAATLRSAVMTVCEKVVEEDRQLMAIQGGDEEAASTAPLAAMTVRLDARLDEEQYGNHDLNNNEDEDEEGETVTLFPCSKDAYLLISDLHRLATGQSPQAIFLQLEHAPQITFCLELLESVLANHPQLFQSNHHPELRMVLQSRTCPLLIQALGSSTTRSGFGVGDAGPMSPGGSGGGGSGGNLGFSIQVRLMRLLFLVLQKFPRELGVEVEVLLTILLRLLPSGGSGSAPPSGGTPRSPPPPHQRKRSSSTYTSAGPQIQVALPWQRILALEMVRSLTLDGELMRYLFRRYDDHHPDAVATNIAEAKATAKKSGAKEADLGKASVSLPTKQNTSPQQDKSNVDGGNGGLVTRLVEELLRIVTEDSSLIDRRIAREQLGSADAAAAAGSGSGGNSGGSASAVGALYEAAAGAVSGVLGGGSETGGGSASGAILSVSSIPTIQFLDQLDKADAPNPSSSYACVLALYALVNMSGACASHVLPAYSAFVNARPKHAPRAPPALDLDSEDVLDQGARRTLLATRRMVERLWTPLLAAFDFLLATRCDEAIFAEVLASWRNAINVAGTLKLTQARDAMMTTLIKFAAPAGIVAAAMETRRPTSSFVGASAKTGADENSSGGGSGLNSGGGNGRAPELSRRQLACLKALAQCVYYLSGSLDAFWYPALLACIQAEFVLHKMVAGSSSGSSLSATASAFRSRAAAGAQQTPPSPFAVAPVEPRSGVPLVLLDLTPEALLTEIGRIVENTAALDAGSLKHFLVAACALSRQVAGVVDASDVDPSDAGAVVAGAGINKTGLLDVKGRSVILSHISVAWALSTERLTLAAQDAGWNPVVPHLVAVLAEQAAQPNVRMQAAATLDSIALTAMAACAKQGAPSADGNGQEQQQLRTRIQQQVFASLEQQAILEYRRSYVIDIEIRRVAMETMLKILENHGHLLSHGWHTVFRCCHAACDELQAAKAAQGKAVRSSAPLVKVAFGVLQLVASDFVTKLSDAQLQACITDFAAFSLQQQDVNVSLTSVGALWGITAEVMRRTADAQGIATALWLHLLEQAAQMTADVRSDTRDAAIQALFRVLEQYGPSFTPALWQQILLDVVYPALHRLREQQQHAQATVQAESEVQLNAPGAHQQKTPPSPPAETVQRWTASRGLALGRLGKVVSDQFGAKIIQCDEFEAVWTQLIQLLDSVFREGPSKLSQAAIEAKIAVLTAEAKEETEHTKSKVHLGHHVAWQHWHMLSADVATDPRKLAHLTQKNLLGKVRAVSSIYTRTKDSFDLDKIRHMIQGLKIILLFPAAGDIPKDVDTLTPLQAAILDAVLAIEPVPGSRALVLSELAQLTSLAVVGAEGTPFTFVALCRSSLAALDRLGGEWFRDAEIYDDGAVATVLSALAILVKMRHECPPSSSNGKELPLWREATVVGCKFIPLCIQQTADLKQRSVAQETWTHIVSFFEAALLPHSEISTDQNLQSLQDDQVFDLCAISTVEKAVLPRIGDEVVPDATIDRLGELLVKASEVYTRDPEALDEAEGRVSPESEASGRKVGEIGQRWKKPVGLTVAADPGARELFAYWLLDLQFLACGSTGAPNEAQKRVAKRLLPLLLRRCKRSLQSYAADSLLRGSAPFPRIRDEELNYILAHLLHLRTVPDASEAFASLTHLGAHIASSDRAHLLPLFSCFAELLALPRDRSRSYLQGVTIGSSVSLVATLQLPAPFQLCKVGHKIDFGLPDPITYDALVKTCLDVVRETLGLP